MIDLILKYPLKVTDYQLLEELQVTKILCAQVQDGTICFWAEVDSDIDSVNIEVIIVGTGQPMSEMVNYKYLDTVQLNGFVWHIYTRTLS